VAKNAADGVAPLIAIDRKKAKPLHRQIYDAYRFAILVGQLQPGQRAPSSRALAIELGVSRLPVLEAYSQLLAEGYFEARQGAGTFVSTSLPGNGRAGRGGHAGHGSPVQKRALSQRSSQIPGRSASPWALGSGAFSVGSLALDHFPFSTWAALTSRHARRVRARALHYADPMGNPELRQTIASYLNTGRTVRCDAEQVMVVSGSQQALDLCARVLLNAGDQVWVEEPGYPLMRQTLLIADAKIVPVPVDAEGLDVAAGAKRAPNAVAAYVTPSHQYPLGMTMSLARRLQLLEWARASVMWILEDDYDSEYRYESMPVASLQGLDEDGRVIYIGTFSKTLFPSLRLGYLVIPADLVDRFAVVRRTMDICASALNQSVLAEFMRDGHFARHLRKTRMVYRERRSALVEAIGREFGPEFQVLGAEAGLHLVLTILPGQSDHRIARTAAEQKLWLWPLSSSFISKATQQGFILGFGNVKENEMGSAVRHLLHLCSLPTK
jgi:GntR family transcriptional regulator / MocR family aminotransferase